MTIRFERSAGSAGPRPRRARLSRPDSGAERGAGGRFRTRPARLRADRGRQDRCLRAGGGARHRRRRRAPRRHPDARAGDPGAGRTRLAASRGSAPRSSAAPAEARSPPNGRRWRGARWSSSARPGGSATISTGGRWRRTQSAASSSTRPTKCWPAAFAAISTPSLRRCRQRRRTLLASSTLTPATEALAARLQRDPLRIDRAAATAGSRRPSMAIQCGTADREAMLIRLLRRNAPASALVFCGRRSIVAHLAARLSLQRLPGGGPVRRLRPARAQRRDRGDALGPRPDLRRHRPRGAGPRPAGPRARRPCGAADERRAAAASLGPHGAGRQASGTVVLLARAPRTVSGRDDGALRRARARLGEGAGRRRWTDAYRDRRSRSRHAANPGSPSARGRRLAGDGSPQRAADPTSAGRWRSSAASAASIGRCRQNPPDARARSCSNSIGRRRRLSRHGSPGGYRSAVSPADAQRRSGRRRRTDGRAPDGTCRGTDHRAADDGADRRATEAAGGGAGGRAVTAGAEGKKRPRGTRQT